MLILPLSAHTFYPTLDARMSPSLVVFTSEGCGACRRLRRVIAGLAPGAGLPEDLVIYEVDAAQAPGLTDELEVFHLPALFVFSEGDFHAPVHTELRPELLIQAVSATLAGPRHEAP